MAKQAKLDHKYAEKLAKIRRTNVQRHAGYENAMKLRQNIVRFQRNATYDIELQRLKWLLYRATWQQANKRAAKLKEILNK